MSYKLLLRVLFLFTLLTGSAINFVSGLPFGRINEVVIFNCYGGSIFETEDYQNGWDAPGQVAGTYFYVLKTIDRSSGIHEFKGWVQVIKDQVCIIRE